MKILLILILFNLFLQGSNNEDDDLINELEILKEEDAINVKLQPQIFAENKLNSRLRTKENRDENVSTKESDEEREQKQDQEKREETNISSKENETDEKREKEKRDDKDKGRREEKSHQSNERDHEELREKKEDDEQKENRENKEDKNNKEEKEDKNKNDESEDGKNSDKNMEQSQKENEENDQPKGEDDNVVYDQQEGGGEDEAKFEEVNWDEGGEGGEANIEDEKTYDGDSTKSDERIIENLSDEDLGKVVRDLLRNDGYKGDYLFEDDNKANKPKKANLEQNVDDVCFYAYEECNYQGRAIRLCGRFPTIPKQLSRMTIRSIQIPRHTRIEFYSSSDYNGEMQSFIGSNRCLINPFTINNLSGGIFAY